MTTPQADSTSTLDKALTRWLREHKDDKPTEPPVTIVRLSPEEVRARVAARRRTKRIGT